MKRFVLGRWLDTGKTAKKIAADMSLETRAEYESHKQPSYISPPSLVYPNKDCQLLVVAKRNSFALLYNKEIGEIEGLFESTQHLIGADQCWKLSANQEDVDNWKTFLQRFIEEDKTSREQLCNCINTKPNKMLLTNAAMSSKHDRYTRVKKRVHPAYPTKFNRLHISTLY